MGKRLKVYLETTFVSWLVARPATLVHSACIQAYTRRWWEEAAPDCDLYVSDLVVQEAVKGDDEQARLRLDVIKTVNVLDSSNAQARELANRLLEAHAVPASEYPDALHIATASVYAMDVLLTWNCRHMANFATLPKTIGVVARAGYECPQIITPKAILEEADNGEI